MIEASSFSPPSFEANHNPQKTKKIEEHWQDWLPALFPRDDAPLAKHHEDFWDWVWAIPTDISCDPFTGFWPRGGAKSTNVERAVVSIGARRIRPYVLYVCATQEQADDHVANISTILQSKRLARYYPLLSTPALNKFGNVKGWRRNRLQTAMHFTVDALGLDTAARGIKIDDDRPGVIILDDLDGEFDSEDLTDKKILMLTKKILPAGARNMVVIFVQNLIGSNTIAARLARYPGAKEIDMLHRRIVSGPFKALDDFEYEAKKDGTGFQITAGTPTWEGQNAAVCQNYIDTFGISSFLSECQHDVEAPDGEMFSHISYRVIASEVPELERTVVWLDPAVTNNDRSDSQGIQADGIDRYGTIYRLFSWEGRSSPQKAVRRAILKAVELGAASVGIETDQGGDTWDSVYREAARTLVEEGLIGELEIPYFKSAKAGAGQGPKVHRAQLQVSAYERGVFVHTQGTHEVLRRAQRRFPKTKPFDLVDVGYWSWQDLAGSLNRVGAVGAVPKSSSAIVVATRRGYRITG